MVGAAQARRFGTRRPGEAYVLNFALPPLGVTFSAGFLVSMQTE